MIKVYIDDFCWHHKFDIFNAALIISRFANKGHSVRIYLLGIKIYSKNLKR
jgi:hypothetical protein